MDIAELLKKRDKELQEARELIEDLRIQLEEYEENDASVMLSESEKRMLRIIEKEMERLVREVEESTLEAADIRKFDTLVKDFVAIRGKMPASKKKDTEVTDDNIADLVELAKG